MSLVGLTTKGIAVPTYCLLECSLRVLGHTSTVKSTCWEVPWSSSESRWRNWGAHPSPTFQPPSSERPRHIECRHFRHFIQSPPKYSWVIQGDTTMVQNWPAKTRSNSWLMKLRYNSCFKPHNFGHRLLCSNISITGMASDFPQDVLVLLFPLATKGSQIFSANVPASSAHKSDFTGANSVSSPSIGP